MFDRFSLDARLIFDRCSGKSFSNAKRVLGRQNVVEMASDTGLVDFTQVFDGCSMGCA